MHYCSAENISKTYGVQTLFSNLSFHIHEKQKIALIARNGTGKSSLLKILAGLETPDEGRVWVHKDVRVALFDQEPVFQEHLSIAENIFKLDHPVMNAIRNYEEVAELEDAEKLMEAIAEMDRLGAWDFDAQVKTILGKLNIHHLHQRMATLSGGQRKRVALARTLIDAGFESNHVLMLMDEPTNHLDLEMVEWLEGYLTQSRMTLLMVTHDRYFLDAVCEEIWELENNQLYTYTGSYENYLEKRAMRIENQASSIEKAKNEYRKELEWMRRQPQARTTKSRSRINAFTDVEARAKQRINDSNLQLNLKMNRLGGKVVLMKKIYKAYGNNVILKGFDYTFNKGERVGIVGKNGVGKSTFLNIVQGIQEPDSGKAQAGDTVIFGHYSQDGLTWKEDMRVIEYVKQFAETFPLAGGGALTPAKFLELFLFPPEKQYTYLSNLSGGEKRRLQLLTILFSNPNFLILDEPTNDLDLPTLQVLEKFLEDFQGCLVIVSHDRYFMDKLVDHLLVFEGDGLVRDFPGNYTQYRIDLWQQEEAGKQQRDAQQKTDLPKPVQEKIKTRLSFNEQREFNQLEKDIPALEGRKKAIGDEMSATTDFETLQNLANEMAALNEQLEAKEMRWLQLSMVGET